RLVEGTAGMASVDPGARIEAMIGNVVLWRRFRIGKAADRVAHRAPGIRRGGEEVTGSNFLDAGGEPGIHSRAAPLRDLVPVPVFAGDPLRGEERILGVR